MGTDRSRRADSLCGRIVLLADRAQARGHEAARGGCAGAHHVARGVNESAAAAVGRGDKNTLARATLSHTIAKY